MVQYTRKKIMAFIHVVEEQSVERFTSLFHDEYEKVRAVSAFTPKIETQYRDGKCIAFLFYTTVDDIQYDMSLPLDELRRLRKTHDYAATQERRIVAPSSSVLIGKRKPTGRGVRTWHHVLAFIRGTRAAVVDAIAE